MLFSAGRRPSFDQVAALSGSGGFAVSYAPWPKEGWFEALVTGLTFEVHGLAPAPAEASVPIAHRYGLTSGWWDPKVEAVTIRLGPHLAGGGAMPPIVRGAVALAMALSTLADLEAVVWLPARSAMAPAYFAEAALAWVAGGAFPTPGLVALVDAPDGGVASQGLAFFTGQEVAAAPWSGSTKSDLARCVVRAVHGLIEHGPVETTTVLPGPTGGRMRIDVEGRGRLRIRTDE